METYKFSELTQESKERAINDFRGSFFHQLFGGGNDTWTDEQMTEWFNNGDGHALRFTETGKCVN